jgi:peptidoglycan-associated lipoprotein
MTTYNATLYRACTLAAALGLGGCSIGKTYDWELVDGPAYARRAAPVVQAPPAQTIGTAQDFIETAGDRVYFAFDQSVLSAEARATLDKQAEWLARYPSVSARIEGNTDERGTREYNLALGERRAEAVRAYLISRGIAASRLSTVSFGEETPLDRATSETAYAQNRNARTVVITAGGL